MQQEAERQDGERSADAVRVALAHILGSPEFVAPERVRSFLSYVVEQTLAGQADQLKGYTIATTVFGRHESFDAQADPVVRIEAGRLRRALERYYLLSGQNAAIRIEVPKGGYVPTFTRRTLPAPESLTFEALPAAAVTLPETGTTAAAGWRALAAVAA